MCVSERKRPVSSAVQTYEEANVLSSNRPTVGICKSHSSHETLITYTEELTSTHHPMPTINLGPFDSPSSTISLPSLGSSAQQSSRGSSETSSEGRREVKSGPEKVGRVDRDCFNSGSTIPTPRTPFPVPAQVKTDLAQITE